MAPIEYFAPTIINDVYISNLGSLKRVSDGELLEAEYIDHGFNIILPHHSDNTKMESYYVSDLMDYAFWNPMTFTSLHYKNKDECKFPFKFYVEYIDGDMDNAASSLLISMPRNTVLSRFIIQRLEEFIIVVC